MTQGKFAKKDADIRTGLKNEVCWPRRDSEKNGPK